MDDFTLKTALAKQTTAGLRMLRQCIELCPADMYEAGTHPRTFVRIAYHCSFYTYWYLQANETTDIRWSNAPDGLRKLWGRPKKEPVPTQEELLAYIDTILADVETLVSKLDLDAPYCGFSWYPKTSKLEHQFVNLRHLEGHVGQLSELLMARGIYIDWIG
jgi:hypothetical protein